MNEMHREVFSGILTASNDRVARESAKICAIGGFLFQVRVEHAFVHILHYIES